MARKEKLAKLLVSTVPLELIVEGGHRIELKLAWTMRAVMLIETQMRLLGVYVNVLQNPGVFWSELDCTKLAVGVWACAQQEQSEYAGEAGLDVVASFMVADNYGAAAVALKNAYLDSLSQETRDSIHKAEEAAAAGEAASASDPIPAPMS